jgi:hypothetical protein
MLDSVYYYTTCFGTCLFVWVSFIEERFGS